MCAKNGQLGKAKRDKKDEFYTQLCDIERELVHYKEHFRGKTVLCNCDDPRVSNFFHYFSYNFEFLGLKAKEIMDEHDLEDALITHLQEFILELGKGFCLEARQKRIIIDDEYYYPDLVFYNPILHCGVIIELKNEEFSHENLGQLNAYVSYYKENEM